jgi:hypothetical protein
MAWKTEFLDITNKFRDLNACSRHSGDVEACANHGLWKINSEESVLRYRIDDIGFTDEAAYFFFYMEIELQAASSRITAFSLVNGAVSDGRLWHPSVQDARGIQHFTGIVARDGDSIVVYVNVNGPGEVTFDIRRLLLLPMSSKPFSIAVVADPWIESKSPSWKGDYIWWFADILLALKEGGASFSTTFLVGEGHEPILAAHSAKLEALNAEVRAIKLDDIFMAASGQRMGLRAQRANDFYLAEAEDEKIVALYRKYLPTPPDVLFCIADLQAVARTFDETLVLFRDAIYCRAPFPDELTSFDIRGLYKNSGIAAHESPHFCMTPKSLNF